ncbi:Fic family protein [Methylobacterium sp. Leaf108]|uniref:Fic family protein n=1 Tax=Methylobacterium sp. Leaf108 TaxID=1736256 RepID=UPI000A86992F|nr:Fic family protein [Methylobacterium sp. Leaf108]
MSDAPSPARAVAVASVTEFRGRYLPIAARLAGYAALIDKYDLKVPLHHEMSAISTKNTRRKEDGWFIYPNSMYPGPDTIDNLIFALKYEGIQLLTLKHIFSRFDKTELEKAALAKRTSSYLRRLCFFYEFLMDDRLQVPDVTAGGYVDAVDTTQQYAATIPMSIKRFRVKDNLPGGPSFCPMVFKTKRIEKFISLGLSTKAKKIVENAPKDLIARAAAFLLLADSKASFAIEGENPPNDRVARWGAVISKAGQIELDKKRLVNLQRELIGDDRFVHIGLREEGGFIGRHDTFSQPEPEHLSAKAEDLEDLLEGLEIFDIYARRMHFHPVLAAACIAFGFVFIHPFEDGNGRIHRFLMHHVLAQFNYTPREIVFPISSVIYDDIARYKDVLESTTRPLLECIEWRPTESGNVDVISDSVDYYRYFDATLCSEYLFGCVQKSVEKNLPEELMFLENRDAFHRDVTDIVDMGERTIDLLLRFLRQNHGKLSRRARENEFRKLNENEVLDIEDLYKELFAGHYVEQNGT